MKRTTPLFPWALFLFLAPFASASVVNLGVPFINGSGSTPRWWYNVDTGLNKVVGQGGAYIADGGGGEGLNRIHAQWLVDGANYGTGFFFGSAGQSPEIPAGVNAMRVWGENTSTGVYTGPAVIWIGVDGAPYRDITFTATNTSDVPVLYGVGLTDQPGVVLASSTQWVEPGGTYTYSVSVKEGDDASYTAVQVDYGATFADGDISVFQGVDASGALTGIEWYDMVGSAVGPSKGYADGTDVVAPTSIVPKDGATPTIRQNSASTTVSPVNVTVQSTGGVVSPTGTTSTGGVTGAEYSKGVDRVVNKLEEVRKAVIASGGGSGGGGSGTDVSGIEDRLDTSNEHLEKVSAPIDAASEFDQGDALSQAQGAADAVSDYAGTRPALSSPSFSFGGGGGDFGSVVVGSQTLTFGINSGIAGTDGLMRALRPALLAALCIGFLRSISGHVTTYTASLPQVQAQDTTASIENVVLGVAQAKTYGTAAAAVVVIFGGAAAIVALADTLVTYYGGGIGGMLSAISMPAGMVAGVIDQYVPLAAGMGLTVLSAAAPYLMAPVYLATSAVLRFLKT